MNEAQMAFRCPDSTSLAIQVNLAKATRLWTGSLKIPDIHSSVPRHFAGGQIFADITFT
jgi:hypothetical protein